MEEILRNGTSISRLRPLSLSPTISPLIPETPSVTSTELTANGTSSTNSTELTYSMVKAQSLLLTARRMKKVPLSRLKTETRMLFTKDGRSCTLRTNKSKTLV
jgi:hypothetical protein